MGELFCLGNLAISEMCPLRRICPGETLAQIDMNEEGYRRL